MPDRGVKGLEEAGRRGTLEGEGKQRSRGTADA
jgi:hypothetical protein